MKVCCVFSLESSHGGDSNEYTHDTVISMKKKITRVYPGFIRVREMSGKFKIFQGQGIVREFHNLSGKIEFLLKCQGILEFQMKFRFSYKKKKKKRNTENG